MTRCTRLYLLGLCCILGGGCAHGVAPLWSQAKPETVITFDPFKRAIYFHNSKDVDLSIEEFTGQTDGTTWTLKGVKVVDNASAVRQANVQQLNAIGPITAEIMAPWRILANRVPIPMPAGSADPQPSRPDTPALADE